MRCCREHMRIASHENEFELLRLFTSVEDMGSVALLMRFDSAETHARLALDTRDNHLYGVE